MSRRRARLAFALTAVTGLVAVGCDRANEAKPERAAADATQVPDTAAPKAKNEAGDEPVSKAAVKAKVEAPSEADTANPDAVALGADGRPVEDIARDERRKPQAVMDFIGIEANDRVVELMAGRGYYVELLAKRVGSGGKVWAHNSPFVLDRFAEGHISARLARLGSPAIERLDTELDDPKLPADLDAVMMVLFYHDTYWQEVDRPKMLAAIHAALADDGVFGLIDHHAEAGSKDRDVKKLHRVDRELVVQEVLAAGFVLDAESELLRHPEDDRKTNVFFMGEDKRDMTDRFVLRFKKAPAG